MGEVKPKIMGILNVTPDSFSDGGAYLKNKELGVQNRAVEERVLQLIDDGADIIDVGGESTGPSSNEVSVEEEMNRVKPVINFASENRLFDKVMFSIDTYKSEVAQYALEHGFGMVNDVTALRGDPKMIDVLMKYKSYVVLMYSKDDTARTTAEMMEYDDVMATIKTFLLERISTLVLAGFPEDRIIVDPGMGMFVSGDPKYSFEIIERLGELKQLGYPILVGVSRKSFLSGEVAERDQASAELSLKAIKKGASIVRLHNVELIKKMMG